MKYRLLVLDVDDTLLNHEKKITTRTKMALIKAQQLGVQIVLATGRPTCGVVPLAKQLELDKNKGFILTYNGGQIINMQSNEVVFEKRMDAEMLPFLEKKAKKNNCSLFTYRDDTIYTNDCDNKWIRQEAGLNGMQISYVSQLSESIDFNPFKCMLVGDDENSLIALESLWKKRLAGTLDAFRSEPYFLEIVPKYIDKANSLSILLERLQINTENIIAMGNGVCDVTMIQLAGFGVAMANAKESVKACADYVTESNDKDGVALVVEKFILSDLRMNEIPLEQINLSSKHALVGNLGIQFTYASEDRVEAAMPVDTRTRQPFGILHGGATLALAETVAGFGSMILCKPDETMVGMQVTGNHVSSAHEGDTVRAVATIIHKGQSSHVWNVDVFTSTDKLVSTVRVLNSVMRRK
ncbi:MAG: Cof-type HAD-IIB family hydrolase [Tannerella sp.]|nr:Cof-type HAD-IIB family hydrolase [Tannerella sp.]